MFLGIDTSCYTTSLALIETGGKLLKDCRRLLFVKEGDLGIPQSQGFFIHNAQLPELFHDLCQGVDKNKIKAVTVSEKPRPQEGSYMPVFRAGFNMAKVISTALNIPLYTTTHQEGHLAAALWSLKKHYMVDSEFLALHISGGTSELLRAKKADGGFDIDILSSSDLAAGQYIDRVGVALGLPFPSGPHLEELALRTKESSFKLPVAVRGLGFSFSGPESAAMRLIKRDMNKEELARAVFISIGEALAKAINNAIKEAGLRDVVIAGGVASNSIIKEIIIGKVKPKGNILFSDPVFARDNAVGVALLGSEKSLIS